MSDEKTQFAVFVLRDFCGLPIKVSWESSSPLSPCKPELIAQYIESLKWNYLRNKFSCSIYTCEFQNLLGTALSLLKETDLGKLRRKIKSWHSNVFVRILIEEKSIETKAWPKDKKIPPLLPF